MHPARSVSEIRDDEDLWQWSRLEIRLNTFRLSTIPQKQLIIIIIIIIIIGIYNKLGFESNMKTQKIIYRVFYFKITDYDKIEFAKNGWKNKY